MASIVIKIGKEVFHVVGFSTDGKIAFRRKIKRLALVNLQKAAFERRWHGGVLERTLCQPGQLGHEPRIIPAIYVKPLVKGQKNDYNDAEAIAEALLRDE